jgi:serine/threonine protein kinase
LLGQVIVDGTCIARTDGAASYDSEMPLKAGDVFAGYAILRVLAADGMGMVYLAQHPRLPRKSALRVLSIDLTADQRYRQQFQRSADVAVTLSHPNIPRIHDRGEYESQFWISMDYVDGRDAAQSLREHFPTGISPHEVLEIVTAVASALDYAHQHAVLHGDVKPANIVLAHPDSDARHVFLVDLGTARRAADATVAYPAPEQLVGERVDRRVDQYALACTAFELLTGSPPADIVHGRIATPPRLSDIRPEYARLDPTFAKAMANNPTDRFPRCQDFSRALQRELTPAPVRAHDADLQPQAPPPATAAPPLPPAPTPHRSRWRPRIVIPALVAILLVAAAAAAAGIQMFDKPTRPTFDGTFTATFGPASTFTGESVGGEQQELTWAVRSACGESGCVATASVIGGETYFASNFVFDNIDGRWIAANVSSGVCDEIDTEVWEFFSLQPQTDGSLAGEYSTLSSQGCTSKQAVTFTRAGDAGPGSEVTDPANQPPHALSPAQALHGRYVHTLTYTTGQSSRYSVVAQTNCLRTGDRCATLLYSQDRVQVLIFENGQWTWTDSDDGTCTNGLGEFSDEVRAEYPLPQPPQHPIELLGGRGHYERTNACPFSGDFSSSFQRTGD